MNRIGMNAAAPDFTDPANQAATNPVINPTDEKVQEVAGPAIEKANDPQPPKSCCGRFFTCLKEVLEKIFCCFCRCFKKSDEKKESEIQKDVPDNIPPPPPPPQKNKGDEQPEVPPTPTNPPIPTNDVKENEEGDKAKDTGNGAENNGASADGKPLTDAPVAAQPGDELADPAVPPPRPPRSDQGANNVPNVNFDQALPPVPVTVDPNLPQTPGQNQTTVPTSIAVNDQNGRNSPSQQLLSNKTTEAPAKRIIPPVPGKKATIPSPGKQTGNNPPAKLTGQDGASPSPTGESLADRLKKLEGKSPMFVPTPGKKSVQPPVKNAPLTPPIENDKKELPQQEIKSSPKIDPEEKKKKLELMMKKMADLGGDVSSLEKLLGDRSSKLNLKSQE